MFVSEMRHHMSKEVIFQRKIAICEGGEDCENYEVMEQSVIK